MKQLNWATLGCGVIANELAHALSKEGRTLYSVANRTHEKAVAFAQKYGISKVYDNIDDVFYDPDVDIIYISTPHNTHINYLRKALSNGKHVLCEKSITLNIAELDEAVSLAKENNVILAEAMTIYHMPVYKKLNEIESELNDARFLRCHQSYLVNMNYVSEANDSFVLQNGDTVLIRAKSKRMILQKVLEYKEKTYRMRDYISKHSMG